MAKEAVKAVNVRLVRLTDVVAVKATATNPAVKRGLKKEGEVYEVHPSHVPYLTEKKYVITVE
ncbi:MAG: hypothetical protein LBS43_07450 [Prevotellaceae bacterium]|jgi:hypothetical protein|nr:hypothetical protein [Prevotellaceae bacterium]